MPRIHDQMPQDKIVFIALEMAEQALKAILEDPLAKECNVFQGPLFPRALGWVQEAIDVVINPMDWEYKDVDDRVLQGSPEGATPQPGVSPEDPGASP